MILYNKTCVLHSTNENTNCNWCIKLVYMRHFIQSFLPPTTFKYTGCHTRSSPQDKAVLHYFSDKYFLNELLLQLIKLRKMLLKLNLCKCHRLHVKFPRTDTIMSIVLPEHDWCQVFFLVNFVFFHLFLDCYIPLWINHLAFIRLSSCLNHAILRHGCTALSFHRRIWPVAVSSKIGSGCHSDMHCGIRVKSYMCACGLGLIKYIFSFLMQRRLLAAANFMFCIMTGCSKCVEHIHFKSGEEISTKNTIIVMM